MLEIFLIMVCLVLAGHRGGGYPSRGRYSLRGVRFDSTSALLALANITVITQGLTGSADGKYRMISIIGTWSLRSHTPAEGPITVGYAHSDYSVTEIKEALEVEASISVGLKVEQEQSNRLVRIVGTFPGLLSDEVLDHGAPIKTRLNWEMPPGVQVNQFAYNNSGATLTTGSIVELIGKCWVKDTS